jgi:hypothetical protein
MVLRWARAAMQEAAEALWRLKAYQPVDEVVVG